MCHIQLNIPGLNINGRVKPSESITNLASSLIRDLLTDNLTFVIDSEHNDTTTAIYHAAQCFHSTVQLPGGLFELNIHALVIGRNVSYVVNINAHISMIIKTYSTKLLVQSY